jgi:hypothetical protein
MILEKAESKELSALEDDFRTLLRSGQCFELSLAQVSQ